MAHLSHADVVEIKSRFELDVLKMPGVTGVDVGACDKDGVATEGYAIRVYVAKTASAPSLPATFEGVPVQVIERNFTLQRE